jgi:metalloendopeptidase OMA1, mitochondrial
MLELCDPRQTSSSAPAGRALSHLVVWLTVLAGLVVAGCDNFVPPAAPEGDGNGEGPGGRVQHLALPPAKEYMLGKRAYEQVLAENRDRLLPQDSSQVRRVRTITSKIVQAVGIRPLQREINLKLQGYKFDWDVNVIEDRQINAFCLPGGKIFVYTGILPVAKSDDQLATVLSHEIAHALAHHSNERIARDSAGNVSVLQSKAYDRAQETEADKIGLFLMTFAGYNPDEAVRFWERMSQATRGSNRPPEFLSDHPSDERRIHNMQEWLPKVKAAKKAFEEGRIAPEP